MDGYIIHKTYQCMLWKDLLFTLIADFQRHVISYEQEMIEFFFFKLMLFIYIPIGPCIQPASQSVPASLSYSSYSFIQTCSWLIVPSIHRVDRPFCNNLTGYGTSQSECLLSHSLELCLSLKILCCSVKIISRSLKILSCSLQILCCSVKIMSFPQDIISFPQDNKSFLWDIISFPQDNKSFPQDNISFSQDNKPFPQDNNKSFSQDIISFPQENKSLSQDIKSFPQDNKLFPQDNASINVSPPLEGEQWGYLVIRQPKTPNLWEFDRAIRHRVRVLDNVAEIPEEIMCIFKCPR